MTFEKLAFSGLRNQMSTYGHTQEDLGKALGVSKNYICNRLNGNVKWTIDDIKAICKIYNKTFEELFY